jgi:predicted MPP superfamily phosphohydrolase
VKVAVGGLAAGLGYGLLVEPRWFAVTHRVMPIRGLPPSLDGLRAVQLSDVHHGPWLSLGQVREVVERTNQLVPDLVFLTGDYVHQSAVYIPPAIKELGQLQPKIGTLAVLGNHDWWEGAALTRAEFARAGIPLIDNARRTLTPDRRLLADANEGLCIAGVGDLWEDRPDYDAALGGVPARVPRVLLSHNPDVAEEGQFVRSGHRVDLMVSGHTHGGQIYIPGLGTPVVPSRYGQKYSQGLVQGPVCPVLISRGIGLTVLPLRLGVRPEITLLELRTAPLAEV